MEHISLETMGVLLEMLEFSKFILQKYSRDYHLQIPKTGFEAQHLEWARKRELLHKLMIWLESTMFSAED